MINNRSLACEAKSLPLDHRHDELNRETIYPELAWLELQRTSESKISDRRYGERNAEIGDEVFSGRRFSLSAEHFAWNEWGFRFRERATPANLTPPLFDVLKEKYIYRQCKSSSLWSGALENTTFTASLEFNWKLL